MNPYLLIDDQPAHPFLTMPGTEFVTQFWTSRVTEERLDYHVGFMI